MEGINTVIRNNNVELQNIIKLVQGEAIKKEQLVFHLSLILASSRTLEILTRPSMVNNVNQQRVPAPKTKESLPKQVAAVEDDNPEQEDKDVKKQREEQRNFFG